MDLHDDGAVLQVTELWTPRSRKSPRVEIAKCAPFGIGLDGARGRAKGANWDPSQLTGVVAWYRGDSLVDSGSGTASSWSDKSGAGRNVTSSSTIRPTITANAIGSRTGVTISSSKYFDGHASLSALSDFTVFAIQKPATYGAGTWRATVSFGSFAPEIGTLGQHPAIYLSNGYSANVTFTAGVAHFVEWNRNTSATKFNFYYDGTADTANPLAGLNTNTAGTLYLGQNGSAGEIFDGIICEIIVLDHLASTAERTNMRGYVLSYYGI